MPTINPGTNGRCYADKGNALGRRGGLAAPAETVQTLDPGAIQPVRLLSADLNRDGYPDLAVACHSSNSVVVFENTRALAEASMALCDGS